MAKSYNVTISAHPNVYNHHERELQIHFCEPELGIDSETGLLLLISGFGESASDDYFKYARSYLADRYNLITVQAEYFGSSFMGSNITPKFLFNTDVLKQVFKEEEWAQIYDGTINMDRLMEIGSKYPLRMEGHAVLEESLEHFNDMGIMQALDNVTAVLSVLEIVRDNDYHIDSERIMAYGQGHGAYLGYLCNAFAPKLFNLLVDHSGWLLPDYLRNSRQMNFRKGQLAYSVVFNYFVKKMDLDEEILRLPSLYKKFFNHANIISFQQVGNGSKAQQLKEKFCLDVKYCMYTEFILKDSKSDESKDNIIKIDSDFIRLFDYVMNNVSLDTKQNNSSVQLPNVRYETKRYKYSINYTSGMPIFKREEKKK
jgi:hypothetical protein